MNMNLYAVRDVLVGAYQFHGEAVNDEVAKRNFLQICYNNQDTLPVTDYEYYRIGSYNTKTGRVESLDTPEFICKGERKND